MSVDRKIADRRVEEDRSSHPKPLRFDRREPQRRRTTPELAQLADPLTFSLLSNDRIFDL
jgi:hypothetical protein